MDPPPEGRSCLSQLQGSFLLVVALVLSVALDLAAQLVFERLDSENEADHYGGCSDVDRDVVLDSDSYATRADYRRYDHQRRAGWRRLHLKRVLHSVAVPFLTDSPLLVAAFTFSGQSLGSA